MREPDIPGHTCPAIDRVIDGAGEHARAVQGAFTAIEEAQAWLNDLAGRWSDMEELRKANAALREAAEYWRERALAAEQEQREAA